MITKKIFSIGLVVAILGSFFISSPVTQAASRSKKKISLTSTAFKNGREIPLVHAAVAAQGQNTPIPLAWELRPNLASKVKSFAIVTVDLNRHAKKWVHFAAINIPADARTNVTTSGWTILKNTSGTQTYEGPNPPAMTGKHIYQTTIYALNVASLNLSTDTAITYKAFQKALKKKIVAKASLKGKFQAGGMSMGGKDKKIEITATGFNPSSITVRKGTTVNFVNKDSQLHWPASNVHPSHGEYPVGGGCIGSLFDACKGLATDEKFTFTFDTLGTWTFHDHLNPSLTGSVRVEQ